MTGSTRDSRTRGRYSGIAIGSVLLAVLMVSFGAPKLPAAEATHNSTVRIGMPFAGDWDRFGVSHPSEHPRLSADWGVDLYAAEGTRVTARFSAPDGVEIELAVRSVVTSCRHAGGKTVILDVYANDFRVGWVSYGHLDRVPSYVREGREVYVGDVLGRLKKWEWEDGCWEVSTSRGVHTHMGARNVRGYACYRNLDSGKSLGRGTWIGKIGHTGATGTRQAC